MIGEIRARWLEGRLDIRGLEESQGANERQPIEVRSVSSLAPPAWNLRLTIMLLSSSLYTWSAMFLSRYRSLLAKTLLFRFFPSWLMYISCFITSHHCYNLTPRSFDLGDSALQFVVEFTNSPESSSTSTRLRSARAGQAQVR